MNFYSFKEQLKSFVVFTLIDIRKIDPEFDRRRLNEWQRKGYLKNLRRGYYCFSDIELNEEMLFLIANKLYTPSYVSLEIALSFYSLIPEGVYTVTSISTKKTARFETPFGHFHYRNMKPRLFFGYHLQSLNDQGYLIAEREKLVLDYLYFHPDIAEEDTFSEWRFNADDFLEYADLEKFNCYAKAFQSKRFLKRSQTLLQRILKSQSHA